MGLESCRRRPNTRQASRLSIAVPLSHLCSTDASIIQSTVGGQGRKTNRRHVASRSKTAEINAPADTTVVCLSHDRVHTLGPNTAARFQTAGQADTDAAPRHVPTSWRNRTFGCQCVNLTCQWRLSADILAAVHRRSTDSVVSSSAYLVVHLF